MKAPLSGRGARGVISVELAMILLATMLLAPCVLTLGKAVRQYVVLEKVSHQAARQMAALPRVQMTKTASYLQAQAEVQARVVAALDAARIDMSDMSFQVDCSPGICGGAGVPQTVRVRTEVTVRPDDGAAMSGWLLGTSGMLLRSTVLVRYEN